jgi:hypothetical protein
MGGHVHIVHAQRSGSHFTARVQGLNCEAYGEGATQEDATRDLVREVRELHEALGPWLAEQGAYEHESLVDAGVHEVAVRESCQSLRGLVAVMLHNGSDAGDYIEGHGASREAALGKLRNLLVELHASHWHAFAQALKGGE